MEVQGRTDWRPYFCSRLLARTIPIFAWMILQSCTSGGSTPPSLDAKRSPTSGPRPLQTVAPGQTPGQMLPQGTLPAGSGTPGTPPTLPASGTLTPGSTAVPGLTRTPGGPPNPPSSPTTTNPPVVPTRTVAPSSPTLPAATPTRTIVTSPTVPAGVPVPAGETARVRVKMSTSGQLTYTIETESGLVASDVRYELAQVASSNPIVGSGTYTIAYTPAFSMTFKAGAKTCNAQVSAVTQSEVVISGRTGGGVRCSP